MDARIDAVALRLVAGLGLNLSIKKLRTVLFSEVIHARRSQHGDRRGAKVAQTFPRKVRNFRRSVSADSPTPPQAQASGVLTLGGPPRRAVCTTAAGWPSSNIVYGKPSQL